MRFLKRFVLVSLAMALMLSPLCAQCVDPAKHFRSGVLRHWIFQLTPGAAALARDSGALGPQRGRSLGCFGQLLARQSAHDK